MTGRTAALLTAVTVLVAAAPPASGESLELTLDAAIRLALEHNPTLEVARYGPRIADTFPPEARAAFDPRLDGSAYWQDSTSQLSAVQQFTFRPDGDGGDEPPGTIPDLERRGLGAEASLRTRFTTGTELSLGAAVDRDETNFTPREYEGSWTLRLVQPLLEDAWREVNLVEVRQAENRAVQSRWELRRTVLELVEQVERTYWELVLARQVVDIRRFGLRLAEEQLELNRDLVDTGRAVRSDLLSAEAERASRRADLEQALGRVRVLEVALRRLLLPVGGEPDLVPVPVDRPVATPVVLDPTASVDTALQRRPELAAERIEIANRVLDVRAREDALEPELDLIASYGRTSLGPDLSGGTEHLLDDSPYDTVRIGVQLGLPLTRRGEAARWERARLDRDRAEAALEDLALRVAEQVRAAAVEVQAQWPRVAATRDAVTAREEELRIEQDRYEVGMARHLDVLLVQRLLIEARVEAATSRVRYRQALASLYRAEGTLLDRRGITVPGAATTP